MEAEESCDTANIQYITVNGIRYRCGPENSSTCIDAVDRTDSTSSGLMVTDGSSGTDSWDGDNEKENPIDHNENVVSPDGVVCGDLLGTFGDEMFAGNAFGDKFQPDMLNLIDGGGDGITHGTDKTDGIGIDLNDHLDEWKTVGGNLENVDEMSDLVDFGDIQSGFDGDDKDDDLGGLDFSLFDQEGDNFNLIDFGEGGDNKETFTDGNQASELESINRTANTEFTPIMDDNICADGKAVEHQKYVCTIHVCLDSPGPEKVDEPLQMLPSENDTTSDDNFTNMEIDEDTDNAQTAGLDDQDLSSSKESQIVPDHEQEDPCDTGIVVESVDNVDDMIQPLECLELELLETEKFFTIGALQATGKMNMVTDKVPLAINDHVLQSSEPSEVKFTEKHGMIDSTQLMASNQLVSEEEQVPSEGRRTIIRLNSEQLESENVFQHSEPSEVQSTEKHDVSQNMAKHQLVQEKECVPSEGKGTIIRLNSEAPKSENVFQYSEPSETEHTKTLSLIDATQNTAAKNQLVSEEECVPSEGKGTTIRLNSEPPKSENVFQHSEPSETEHTKKHDMAYVTQNMAVIDHLVSEKEHVPPEARSTIIRLESRESESVFLPSSTSLPKFSDIHSMSNCHPLVWDHEHEHSQSRGTMIEPRSISTGSNNVFRYSDTCEPEFPQIKNHRLSDDKYITTPSGSTIIRIDSETCELELPKYEHSEKWYRTDAAEHEVADQMVSDDKELQSQNSASLIPIPETSDISPTVSSVINFFEKSCCSDLDTGSQRSQPKFPAKFPVEVKSLVVLTDSDNATHDDEENHILPSSDSEFSDPLECGKPSDRATLPTVNDEIANLTFPNAVQSTLPENVETMDSGEKQRSCDLGFDGDSELSQSFDECHLVEEVELSPSFIFSDEEELESVNVSSKDYREIPGAPLVDLGGDVLLFVPGKRESIDTQDVCSGSSTSSDEQDDCFPRHAIKNLGSDEKDSRVDTTCKDTETMVDINKKEEIMPSSSKDTTVVRRTLSSPSALKRCLDDSYINEIRKDDFWKGNNASPQSINKMIKKRSHSCPLLSIPEDVEDHVDDNVVTDAVNVIPALQMATKTEDNVSFTLTTIDEDDELPRNLSKKEQGKSGIKQRKHRVKKRKINASMPSEKKVKKQKKKISFSLLNSIYLPEFDFLKNSSIWGAVNRHKKAAKQETDTIPLTIVEEENHECYSGDEIISPISDTPTIIPCDDEDKFGECLEKDLNETPFDGYDDSDMVKHLVEAAIVIIDKDETADYVPAERFFIEVCHHSDCRDKNNQHPLSLCSHCDDRIHSDPEFRGHLRLDLHSKEKNGLTPHRRISTISLPESNANSESSTTSGIDLTDSSMSDSRTKDDKANSDTPSINIVDGTDATDTVDGIFCKDKDKDVTDATAAQAAAKFKRKKVLKNRRPHTEERTRSQSLQIERDHNIPTVLLTRASTFAEKCSPPPSPRPFLLDTEMEKHSISKECFTVKYDILSEPEIDILAAIKGVQLRDALAPYFAKRGILIEKIHAYLDASHTPLPLVIDTFPLGGSQLHIRAKDNNTSPFGRGGTSSKTSANSSIGKTSAEKMKQEKKISSSSGSLGRAQKKSSSSMVGLEELFTEMNTNTSPYNSLTAADSKKLAGRSSSSKLGALFLPNFSKDSDKQHQLAEQILQYSLTGLPSWPSLLTLGEPTFDKSLFELERHWTDFIDKTDMTKKERDQQEAVWELLHTEVHYIEALNVICDLFYCCLINLQNEQLLNEIETEKLFSNIREVRTATCQFWQDDLLKVLEHSRTNHVPLDPLLLLQGFSKFEKVFQPYTKYCLEQTACLEYMRMKYREHDLFRTFVEWAEGHIQCNRLRLHDLVVKPMQRLTRYSLLLKAIVKKTDKESSKRELNKIIDNVDRFVRSVDSTLRQSHEAKRLADIIDRIESYDAVDLPTEEASRAMIPYSMLDLTCRMPGCGPRARRNLIMEKSLKLKEGNSKVDVICLLFTDMLLITKPTKGRGDKVKVIKPPMRVDRIIKVQKDLNSFLLVYLNEYNVVQTAYLFQGEHVEKFVAMFMKAQHLYKQAREEHSTDYLLHLDADFDDPSVAILGQPPKRKSSKNSVKRSDSVESLEGKFVPNTIPKCHSSETINQNHVDMDTPVFSGEGHSNSLRPRAQSYSGERLRPANALFIVADDDINVDSSPAPSPRSETSEQSPNMSPKIRRRSPVDPTNKPKPVKVMPRNESSSSSEMGTTSPGLNNSSSSHKHLILPNKPQIDILSDDQLKGRLNQRRISRGEKRYHTADSIQDIQKQESSKDTAIHKRLSWHLGTMDINIDERSGILKNKTFSSDSLRSVPSSSGVSSTQSLHLSPDSEISEENEIDLQILENDDSTDVEYPVHFPDVGESETDTDATLIEGASDKKTRFDMDETDNTPEAHFKSNHLANSWKSKSMSDISNIMTDLSPTEVKDGIASVNLPNNNRKKQLSHAEILRMKKQLLLNSSAEASEV